MCMQKGPNLHSLGTVQGPPGRRIAAHPHPSDPALRARQGRVRGEPLHPPACWDARAAPRRWTHVEQRMSTRARSVRCQHCMTGGDLRRVRWVGVFGPANMCLALLHTIASITILLWHLPETARKNRRLCHPNGGRTAHRFSVCRAWAALLQCSSRGQPVARLSVLARPRELRGPGGDSLWHGLSAEKPLADALRVSTATRIHPCIACAHDRM